ncbi:hypothetical protein [Terracoccus luteus]|uniref:Uncharacterized protein n=1 Tax=Terracoccus luteus TaxID=53356 RepID=A0A839PY81_9MICO|nr:hypothetical protein [Terracoccus luteus]MBB2988487.1 hypothetical protein [Terracoccus luteus]MCP2174122.1 hypothetical protein [Terracoccus luteus]
MATPTLAPVVTAPIGIPDAVATTTADPASTGRTAAAAPGSPASVERVGALAVAAPLLLWAHGILAWVDGLGATRDLRDRAQGQGTLTTLDYAAGSLGAAAIVLLAAAVVAFAWLTAEVVRRPSVAARLGAGSLVTAGAGLVAVVAPLGLLPLGALLMLVGLAPLSRNDAR